MIALVPANLSASDDPLAASFDVALLDLDGVVYVGPDAVPGAPRALAAARDAGMRLAFVTNNAARPPEVVAAHLSELEIAAEASEVITSAQAAARYLGDRLTPGARVLVVGTTGLWEALTERGLTPVADASGHVDAVVQGYSPALDWPLLAEGAVAINRGVPWVATNIDPTVPSPRGPLPGNGSMVAALRHATGQTPVVTGKPDPTMHRETMLRTGAERPLVVGDRLDTDIEGARAVGCPSLLVFSGVTAPRDLLSARAEHRPDFLAADVSGLLASHRTAQQRDDGWHIGGWRASAESDALVLIRTEPVRTEPNLPDVSQREIDDRELGDRELDALRALCPAAWEVAPAGREVRVRAGDHGHDGVAEALSRLGLE